MITHSEVWRAIDLLVAQNGLSISELARQAGRGILMIPVFRSHPVGICWVLYTWATAMPMRWRFVVSRWSRGDVVIVSQNSAVLPADRVVVKNREVRLASINRAHGDLVISRRDVEWISRIVWVSQ